MVHSKEILKTRLAEFMHLKIPDSRLVQTGNTLYQIVLRNANGRKPLQLEYHNQRDLANAIALFVTYLDIGKKLPAYFFTKSMKIFCMLEACNLDDKFRFTRNGTPLNVATHRLRIEIQMIH